MTLTSINYVWFLWLCLHSYTVISFSFGFQTVLDSGDWRVNGGEVVFAGQEPKSLMKYSVLLLSLLEQFLDFFKELHHIWMTLEIAVVDVDTFTSSM